jgi:hypothetical protein
MNKKELIELYQCLTRRLSDSDQQWIAQNKQDRLLTFSIMDGAGELERKLFRLAELVNKNPVMNRFYVPEVPEKIRISIHARP